MKVVSVDPGAVTGIAWSEDGTIDPERSTTWDFRKQEPGERWCALLERLKSAPVRPDLIAYEFACLTTNSKKEGGEQRARLAAGYRAIVECYAWHIGAQFVPVAPATWKKWGTGHGLAPKADREADPMIEKKRMRSAAC